MRKATVFLGSDALHWAINSVLEVSTDLFSLLAQAGDRREGEKKSRKRARASGVVCRCLLLPCRFFFLVTGSSRSEVAVLFSFSRVEDSGPCRPNFGHPAPPFEIELSTSRSRRRGKARACSKRAAKKDPASLLLLSLGSEETRPHQPRRAGPKGEKKLNPYRQARRRGRCACPRARQPTHGRRPRSRGGGRPRRWCGLRGARGRRGRMPFFFFER